MSVLGQIHLRNDHDRTSVLLKLSGGLVARTGRAKLLTGRRISLDGLALPGN